MLDGAMHSDLVSIMKRHSPSNGDDVSDSKFKIFLAATTESCFIKRCSVYAMASSHTSLVPLHHRSTGCYSTLQSSGVLVLPSERTL